MLPPDKFNVTAKIVAIIAAAECKEAQEALGKFSKEELNIRDRFSETALMIALQAGKTKVAEALCDSGADVMALDRYNNTTLHCAAFGGCIAFIPRLIASGIKLEARTNSGKTVLLVALDNGQACAVEALLEAGADVMAVDNDGHTALHYAAIGSCTAIIPKLIASGVKMEAKNNSGKTALFVALLCGKTEFAEALLETGADVTVVDVHGDTTLYHAARRDCTAIVPSLIAKGAAWKKLLGSGEGTESRVYQLVQIFHKVQDCFDPTLLQSLAKYLELLLQEQQQKSLLLIEPKQLSDFVLQNFDKIAPIFFKPFSKQLQEAQFILKETDQAIDEDKARSLLTEAIAERIALILSLSSKVVASVWKSCIDVLMFEPADDKLLALGNFAVLPKRLVDLTLSYVWGDGSERRAFAQNLEFLNGTDFLEMIEKGLGIQASTDKLEQRLLEQRLSSCCSYLAQRAENLVSSPQKEARLETISPNTLVLFSALFPKTPPKTLTGVGAETIETKLSAEEQSLTRKGQSKHQAKIAKTGEKSCEPSQIHTEPASISGSSNSPLYDRFKEAERSLLMAASNTIQKNHS